MICPLDQTQMVNFTQTGRIDIQDANPESIDVIVPLPSGGIANDDVYETWYVYECPKCRRRVKEAYRCEVLYDK